MSAVAHPLMNDNSGVKPVFTLALDIGTSSVRAGVYDADGYEISGTAVNLEREFHATSDGSAEYDANEAIEQVASLVDVVLDRASTIAAEIEIVAISCFWHSLVGLNQDDKPITPVLGWADTRAEGMVRELQHSFDEPEVHTRTGCRFHPSYWPAKLLWLQQHDAPVYANIVRWVSLSELILQQFFGKTAISVSMASATGLFDQRRCHWDEALLEHLGVGLAQLPRIANDGEYFSGLLPKYAERWPRLDKARWFPAIGDGAANNIGAGCVTQDRAALMIGTSGAMRIMWQGAVPETIPPELWCYRADRKRVVIGGALSDGGGLFQWMKSAFAPDVGEVELERALGAMQPDAHALTLLPFWAGERSTGWHASARGAIIGLTQDTEPLEIVRASMEAVAYRFACIARVLDEFAPNSSIVASGGALNSSPVWTQIIADVLGRPVSLSDANEASSRGAVLLALEMEGRIGDIADVPLSIERTYEPDMANHARYCVGLERQEKLYATLIT